MSTPTSAQQILKRLEQAAIPIFASLCPDETASAFGGAGPTPGSADRKVDSPQTAANALVKAIRLAIASLQGPLEPTLSKVGSMASASSSRGPRVIPVTQRHADVGSPHDGNSSATTQPARSGSRTSHAVSHEDDNVDDDDDDDDRESTRSESLIDLPPPLEVGGNASVSLNERPTPTGSLDAVESLVTVVIEAISASRRLTQRHLSVSSATNAPASQRRQTVMFCTVSAFDTGSFAGTPDALQPADVSDPDASGTSPIGASVSRRASRFRGGHLAAPPRAMLLISPRNGDGGALGFPGGATGASRRPSRRVSILPADQSLTEDSFRTRPRSDSVWSIHNGPTPQLTTDAIVGDEEFDGTSTINQYVLLSSIGRGAQGEVMLAMDTNTNELRAIKVVSRPPDAERSPGQTLLGQEGDDTTHKHVVASTKSRLAHSRSKLGQLQREIAAMKRCRHRNIVALYEVIDDPAVHSLYLVMQYVDHGSLVTMRKDGTPSRTIAPDVLAGYTRQLCAGLLYLHNHGIVHRDIKPDNILLGADDVVYLSDFGVSDVFDHTARSGAGPVKREVFGTRGTTLFFAPELLEAPSSNSRSHIGTDVPVDTLDIEAENQADTAVDGQAVDVWALGMTLYVLLYGRLPWGSSRNMSECFDQIIGAPIPFPNSVPAAPSPDSTSLELTDTIELDAAWIEMLRGMLQRDVARRWPIERVRDAARRLADLAESREIEGSPLTSPGLQGLTQITQISDLGREALQHARRGSAHFSDTDGELPQHLGPHTPPGPGRIAERAPRDAAHESRETVTGA